MKVIGRTNVNERLIRGRLRKGIFLPDEYKTMWERIVLRGPYYRVQPKQFNIFWLSRLDGIIWYRSNLLH